MRTSKYLAGVATVALTTAFFPMTGSEATAQTVLDRQTVVEFDGSKSRVNLSGRLRMMTERMAGATCRLGASYDTQGAMKELGQVANAYDTILSALKNGNTKMGVPTAEKSARVKRAIGKLERIWTTNRDAVNELLEGRDVAKNVAIIGENAPGQRLAANDLASEMISKYTNPAELQSNAAFTINVAGRQRALTQSISKQSCAVLSGQTAFGTPEGLQKDISIIEKSFVALRDGNPTVGIMAPPNDALREKLVDLETELAVEHGLVDELIAGGDSAEELAIKEHKESLLLMRKFNNIVTLYMVSTDGAQDAFKIPLREYAAEELSNWVAEPNLVAAVKSQNAKNANLAQADIDTLDAQWRQERSNGGDKPMIQAILGTDVSQWLAQKQQETSGFVTEVFAMDNKGLNVSQSRETTDLWQGDEDKWQVTFGEEIDGVHIGEIEYDDSTGMYQSQVSMPIRDGDDGPVIGAITFGINVQSLL